jgi:adenylate cyclase
MVDKIVGDAVHAIFNAPLDTPDHAARAIACARAIDTFSEAFRQEPLARALQFGQTRIGLDTGPAIVGDVGGHRKLDYTAHGEAVNAAARLEVANKQLGTRIAIGAGAKEASGADLRALGPLELRGLTRPALVFTVWPADIDAMDRSREAAAIRRWLDGDAIAIEEIGTLAARRPQDDTLNRLAVRAKLSGQTRQIDAEQDAETAPGLPEAPSREKVKL